MTCKAKTGGSTAKQIEIWDSRVTVERIWHTFDLIVFKVILGYSVHVSEAGR